MDSRGDGRRTVLFAARSANGLYPLLDARFVFAGDDRVTRLFTLAPGSEFQPEAQTALQRAGASTIPWIQACEQSVEHPFDLILSASPKGEVRQLRGPLVLLPHGAGFNKAVPGEGTHGVPSGLDPVNLLADGRPVAELYALAHPSQLDRLARLSREAAEHAVVTGDPTLDRMLASRTHRDRYRERLGTGARRLIVLASTWGPESLIRRRPGLYADLSAQLPHDAYQLASVIHPNVHSELGDLNLDEDLATALEAGLIQAGPYEEWAALLIAADAVITDHGSTALYAAALDCPVIGACDGGPELLPDSPMADLLASIPRLERPDDLDAAIAAYRPGSSLALAEPAFAERGHAIDRLRAEVYRLLDLAPPTMIPDTRPLPDPVTRGRWVSAFDVNTFVGDADRDEVRVERFPAPAKSPGHHLAAEYGQATDRQIRTAGLIYLRASALADAPASQGDPYSETWTEAGWIADVLAEYPACRTAAVILSPELCVARIRDGSFMSVRIEPLETGGRVVRTDPAAVLSAVHARMSPRSSPPADITCVIGRHRFQVRLRPAADRTRASQDAD